MSDGAETIVHRGGRRFAAFISYAHADAAIAAKLQSKLERYRLPKHIAQSHAEGRAALGQIFRDREDLAAAPSLSHAIQAAIGEAEALVIICSPDAKTSRWVGEEISLFRQLHPDGPILAALVRGEPGEAFPEALTEGGTEPLAADLRAEGDGEALGFLKIVAGIAGVPLDALVQRDAQRRLRRVTWITGGALAAMLIMGIMTAFAIQSRNEAARQRAEAEGLVEYMLTDLRDKLKGVNRLDVMQAVNKRAMDHYSQQGDLESLPGDSLETRARILHAMGEDDDRGGRLNDALAKFRESHRTTAALLLKEPNNPDRVFAHAQSEYWVGFAAWRKNDALTATRHWQQYLKQASRLAELEPKTVRSFMELGYANGNICDALLKAKTTIAKATEHCEAAVHYERAALALQPSNPKIAMDLANRLGWLADVELERGQFDNAIAHRYAEQDVVRRLLRSDPDNFELRFRTIWPDAGIGWVHFKMRQYNRSITLLDESLGKLEQLRTEYPKDQLLAIAGVRTAIMLAMAQRDGGASWQRARQRAAASASNILLGTDEGAKIRTREMLEKFDRETANGK